MRPFMCRLSSSCSDNFSYITCLVIALSLSIHFFSKTSGIQARPVRSTLQDFNFLLNISVFGFFLLHICFMF